MKLTSGLTAWVSGAGSGIGRGLAMTLAGRGLAVAAADIRAEAAEATAQAIRAAGGRARGFAVDVSDAGSVEAAARAAEAALGPVSLVANNAGVAMHGVPLHQVSPEEWDWVIGVNIRGVINGIQAFLPGMLERGTPGHIVNTASIGGFQVNPDFLTAPYSMTKYAVVALSEGLRNELAGGPVGVSVLAPAAVDTGIHLSARARPDRFGGPGERPQNHFMGALIADGAAPEEIGAIVAEAIEDGQFWIFSHPETQVWIDRRHEDIRAGFAWSRARAARAKAAE